MATQERLNLDESTGLNSKPLEIGSASATVQQINETKPSESSTKKSHCLSTSHKKDDGGGDEEPPPTTNGSSKHKVNATSNDLLKSSKPENEVIPLKNLKTMSSSHQVVDNSQVKINLMEEDKKRPANEKSDPSLSGGTTRADRKKFFEFSLSKVNRKTLKRPLPCLFAWTLLIGTTGAYFAMVAPKLLEILDEDYLYWLSVVGAQSLIFVYVLVNFLIATMRDPGRFSKVVISPDDPSFNDDTKSPLYKTVKIKNTQIKIKWCSVSVLYNIVVTLERLGGRDEALKWNH